MRVPYPSDPLLTATKFAAIAMKVAIGIGIGAIILTLPVILLNQEAVASELIKAGKTIEVGTLVGWLALLLPLVAGFLALAFWFVHLLGRIVDTVGEGDPFIPANADRLRTMGWVTLAIQLMTIPIRAVAGIVAKAVEDTPSKMDFDIDLTGLVLVLILFVLARVFRRGAEMREELEGTV